MNNWINTRTDNYTGLLVKEIACPYCKHKETITKESIIPRRCYVCDRELKYKEAA